MPFQGLLTEPQRLAFNAPATDERGMVRHYTLIPEDLALINRRRGDANRLGFAIMLCYLRFPGRILQQGEQPPVALCVRLRPTPWLTGSGCAKVGYFAILAA